MSEEEQRLARNRVASRKLYYKNKANEYPCPECGKIINKTVAGRHNQTVFHKYGALLKTTNQELTQST